MANILSLAMKVSADASGVIKSLTPAERALENLAKQASKATSAFDVLAKDSQAAADAQAALNEKFNTLAKQLQGGLNAQAYADQYAALQQEVRNTADAFAEGARITEQVRTAEERHGQELAKLDALLQKNAISEETHTRAVAKADAALLKASTSADKFADETTRAATQGLKFNELSGILAALPGPLGNIAGRFSGIASASEGLSRVFSGGLKTGLSSLGSQLSALASPLNIGIASFAAFGAAATAITRGLADLEGRVEQLGNTALRLGTDFETIQILDEAARRSGVSIDALATGIQKLAVNIDEARSGTGKAADAFRELGISQEQLATLDPATLAQETAKALQAIEDPARRAALATETLGKAGLTLVPVFNAIGESEVALKRFAAAISEVDLDRISSLGSAFDNVKTSLGGLGQSIVLPFAGAVEGASNLFADFIGTVSRLAQAIGTVLTPMLDTLGKAFDKFGGIFRTINDYLDSFGFTSIKVAGNAKEFRAEVQEDTKALQELTKAIESGNDALNSAINKAAEFGQAGFDAAYQFQQALAELKEQAAEENYNGEQYARAVANATVEYEKQITAIAKVADATKKAADEAKKKAEDDKKRIEELLNPNDSAAKVQADISLAIAQQAEAEKKLAAARAAGDKVSADAAASRLAQLDQLRTKLEDQSQAISQGFADGFSAAFNNTAESISGLIDKAGEFGNAGAEAAMKLQEGVALAQQQARDGIILSSDVYEKEISRQRSIFEERLAQIEQLKRAEQEAKAAAFQLEVDANQRVNEFIAQRTQAEVAGAEQAAARRQQAAFNIEAIEQRIALERQSLEAAREQNDMNSARAAVQRIDLLKDALAVEQDISNGRERQLQTQQQLIESQQQYDKQQQAAVQAYQQQQQQAQQQYAQEQARIFEEQRKAAEAEAKRQEERLAKLNTLGDQTIGVQDVRTTQGANLVLNLAANAQDPALIQQRLQTKLLERIALGVGQAASNYFNQPVAIVGAARFN
jgi:hypothetical protein